jgi:NAD(P)H dehydrogenase (quinone)
MSYGPSHYSGGQSNLPLSAEEKAIALAVGKRLAKTAIKLLEINQI